MEFSLSLPINDKTMGDQEICTLYVTGEGGDRIIKEHKVFVFSRKHIAGMVPSDQIILSINRKLKIENEAGANILILFL